MDKIQLQYVCTSMYNAGHKLFMDQAVYRTEIPFNPNAPGGRDAMQPKGYSPSGGQGYLGSIY